ncbi:hypothetical protein [Noviherbaspirillum saxi]|uniref:Uncharacterized protein n=1 Tax=Noviherbaspirillum saxi TaxID=2320863 RepID=A0A3A3FKM1_9BURK|nr:hypothetical protein [Noviherbaspirillum saxi]RJF95744.1 hypothetical protein D3871_20405 [Noviherbaspirillum saxi]
MNLFHRLANAFLILLIAGCATKPNHVIFVTKTSLGLDVDTTPPVASLAYDRVEGYIGPRYENGLVPPVAASFSTNGEIFGRQIKQVYATGNAARIATDSGKLLSPVVDDYNSKHEVMHFGTGTVLGIKFGFSPTGVESFTIGYKRKEYSVIPMTPAGLPSVLANLDSNAQAKALDKTELGIEQYFATGRAADQLAHDPRIRAKFIDQAVDALAQYRSDEIQQSRYSLGTLNCLARVDDSALVKVWSHAETVSLFDDPAIPGRLRAGSAKESRALYTREIGILTPKSPVHTANLRSHRAFVCDLVKT